MLSKINFLMNKIYLFTAAFAVMASLSGCSDTELASIDTAQEKTPIGFHTVGSQMGSRATIINNGEITKTDFKVYAFTNDGTAFMGNIDTDDHEMAHNGVHIKYDNTTNAWTYAKSSDLRYWPIDPLDFYAVSPATFSEDLFFGWIFNPQKRIIKYTSSDEYNKDATTPAANVDVMYAVAKGQTKANGQVNLTFKHILSQVLFKAKTNDDKLKVEIENIKIRNFHVGGTFTIPEGNPTSKNWSLADISPMFTLTAGMDGTKTVTSTSTEIITKPMLFVPQSLTAWKPSEKNIDDANKAKLTYLEISCRIEQNGTYLFGKDGFKTLYVPFSATWEPGKRYVYTLIFGGGYTEESQQILTPISFTASAEDWKADTGNLTNGNDIVTQ